MSKVSTHRGRKPSGKPGATHLDALQKAHGSGDFKSAKTHALNYANACTKHGTPEQEAAFHGTTETTTAPNPINPRRAQLAKLVMGRKK